jgi:trans-2,3-dihydro-3-hydroxyanthranilate isomerase
VRRFAYELLDVFTDVPFGGNPLAVFPEATGLGDGELQLVARELALCETVFVLPPRRDGCDARTRIFTPTAELPTAGHPTIGAAFLLSSRGLGPRDRIVLEQGIGPVEVRFERTPGAVLAVMRARPPAFGAPFSDLDALAQVLSVPRAALDARWGPMAVSCGVPYLVVPLAEASALAEVSLELGAWRRHVAGFEAPHIVAFARDERGGAAAELRMFAPAIGIPEDPATGSAVGPLAAFLWRHGAISTGEHWFLQGHHMGRPSRLRVTLEGGPELAVSVAGTSVVMGAGELRLP